MLRSNLSDSRREARRLKREAARQLAYERGETSAVRTPVEGLSTQKIVRATIDKIRELAPDLQGDFLDVGAGNGELIDRVIREFRLTAHACDYRNDLMTIGGLQVDAVDLNTEPLPYANASFDLVTWTEVIEHLEHYRAALREVSRVLRPGGVFVVSTPNVLNLRSRLRYLFFGFFNLFGLIRVEDERHHSTHGHISPVSYFYLAHALAGPGSKKSASRSIRGKGARGSPCRCSGYRSALSANFALQKNAGSIRPWTNGMNPLPAT